MTPLNPKIYEAFYQNRTVSPFTDVADKKRTVDVHYTCRVLGCPHLGIIRCNKANKCVYLLEDTGYLSLTKLVVLNETIKPSVD